MIVIVVNYKTAVYNMITCVFILILPLDGTFTVSVLLDLVFPQEYPTQAAM